MKRLAIILFFIILVAPSVFSICNDDQVDINTAPKEDLVKIIHIGDSRADQLIELRLFDSVDDLIRISGIGEFYLGKIKEQGLACVENVVDEEPMEEPQEEITEEPIEETQGDIENKEKSNEKDKEKTMNEEIKPRQVLISNPVGDKEPKDLGVIKLDAQTIKSQDNNEDRKNSNIMYFFVAFAILLGILIILMKKKQRSEF